jgi:chaperone protein EcpD
MAALAAAVPSPHEWRDIFMKPGFLKQIAMVSMACIISLAAAALANASVVITGTRVIYPAKAREVTVKLNNNGNAPALVQSWIDDGDASVKAQQRPMPFTLTPPVFRIDPGKGQTLRVTYTKEPLPVDRESVYWLNVLEIPPKPQMSEEENRNYLQMAFRSRIKLFFRPTGLEGNAGEAAARLAWSLARSSGDGKQVVLLAKNPTPYYVTVARASVDIDGKTYESESGMIDPRGQQEFVLNGLRQIPQKQPRIQFATINDYGATVPGTFTPENR